jgi:hypothetical protein
MLVDDFEDFQVWTEALWERAEDSRRKRAVVRTAIAWTTIHSDFLHAPDAVEEDMRKWLEKFPPTRVEGLLHGLAAWGWFDIEDGELVPSLRGADSGPWPDDL